MRLSDAGFRQGQSKLIYPDHRSPPWLTEDAPRDRSNRLLDEAPGSKSFLGVIGITQFPGCKIRQFSIGQFSLGQDPSRPVRQLTRNPNLATIRVTQQRIPQDKLGRQTFAIKKCDDHVA